MDQKTQSSSPASEPARKPYEAPKIMVMDDKEMLKVFQITSAGTSWWG